MVNDIQGTKYEDDAEYALEGASGKECVIAFMTYVPIQEYTQGITKMQGCFEDIFSAMHDIIFPMHRCLFSYLYILISLYDLAISLAILQG